MLQSLASTPFEHICRDAIRASTSTKPRVVSELKADVGAAVSDAVKGARSNSVRWPQTASDCLPDVSLVSGPSESWTGG